MSDYDERIIIEKQDIDKKINCLIAFMDTNGFTLINPKEKKRLEKQLLIMEEYSKILSERIDFI